MTRTLDDLLTDLSEVVPIINAEKHRVSVAAFVRKVSRRIGNRFLCDVYTLPFELHGGRIALEDYMIDVLDAGLSEHCMEGVITRGVINRHHRLAFSINPFDVQFHHKDSGTVWLAFYGLALDADKHPLIPELAFDACYNYALGKLLFMNALHPMHSEWQIIDARASEEINRARADFNQRGLHAQNRAMRQTGNPLSDLLNRDWHI